MGAGGSEARRQLVGLTTGAIGILMAGGAELTSQLTQQGDARTSGSGTELGTGPARAETNFGQRVSAAAVAAWSAMSDAASLLGRRWLNELVVSAVLDAFEESEAAAVAGAVEEAISAQEPDTMQNGGTVQTFLIGDTEGSPAATRLLLMSALRRHVCDALQAQLDEFATNLSRRCDAVSTKARAGAASRENTKSQGRARQVTPPMDPGTPKSRAADVGTAKPGASSRLVTLLLEGWQQVHDQQGRSYFRNAETGESHWTDPTAWLVTAREVTFEGDGKLGFVLIPRYERELKEKAWNDAARRYTWMQVAAVEAGSQAEAAGVRPGLMLYTVSGKPVLGLDRSDVKDFVTTIRPLTAVFVEREMDLCDVDPTCELDQQPGKKTVTAASSMDVEQATVVDADATNSHAAKSPSADSAPPHPPPNPLPSSATSTTARRDEHPTAMPAQHRRQQRPGGRSPMASPVKKRRRGLFGCCGSNPSHDDSPQPPRARTVPTAAPARVPSTGSSQGPALAAPVARAQDDSKQALAQPGNSSASSSPQSIAAAASAHRIASARALAAETEAAAAAEVASTLHAAAQAEHTTVTELEALQVRPHHRTKAPHPPCCAVLSWLLLPVSLLC